MNFDEYQALARRTQNGNLSAGEKERHALHGMAGEVGEIHGLFQKVYQGHALDIDRVKSELGDLMWFMAELADSRGFTLGEAAEHNIDKLRARYPEGFDADKSLHRAAGDL